MTSAHGGIDDETLFAYTGGRWLWNENEQLKARYRKFNVQQLKNVACQATRSMDCISLEKVGEGNYNKAFRLVMGDGQSLIAKIPNPNAGPPEYTTASEVATMDFARTILGLPVPKVLAWSSISQNPVEAEYIIMEEASGTQLHKAWPTLDLRAKRNVIREIVDLEKKMLSISFEMIGSLYFHDSGYESCMAPQITAGSRELEDKIKSRYAVGPLVRQEFWTKERAHMPQYHGPWPSATQYLESIAQREIDWIRTYSDRNPQVTNVWLHDSTDQRSPEAHITLLSKFRSAVPDIVPKDPELCSPRFWHPDFHHGNIYVDDRGKISSIIDWQGAWISPLFIGANPPMVLDYSVEMMMKFPDNFKQLDEATKDSLRYQVSQSILIHSYETRTASENPLMHKVMRHLQGKTLKELEAFANATWDNCLFPLRECLIRIKREWNDFGSETPCPYSFSSKEIRQHQAEATAFNVTREFWDSVKDLVTDEGYTHFDDFGKTSPLFRQLRDRYLESLEGEEHDEFEKRTRWVTELPS